MNRNVIRTVPILVVFMLYQSLAHGQAGSISGVVTDDGGTPLSCAAIIVDGPGGFRLSTTTDDNGVYMMEGLEQGEYEVQVHAPGVEIEPDATKAPQRVRVPVAVGVGGAETLDFSNLTFRDAADLHVIQGFVLLNNENRDPVPDCEMFIRTPDCEVMDVTFTCREGLYELVVPEEIASEVTVSFQLPDFEPAPLTFTPEATGITMADDILIDMFGDDVGAILGHVTDDDGAPVHLAEVSVSPSAKQATFETNCEGDFRANGLTPGMYTVTVSAEGFEPAEQTIDVVAGATPAEVQFELSTAGAFACSSGTLGDVGSPAADFVCAAVCLAWLIAVGRLRRRDS